MLGRTLSDKLLGLFSSASLPTQSKSAARVSVLMILALFSALSFLLPVPTQAAFMLESPLQITSSRSVQLATSQDGQEILITWNKLDSVDYRVSHDGGLSFSPVKVAVEAPESPLEGLSFEIENGTAPVFSADGLVAHIMAGLVLETDPISPPPGWPADLKLSLVKLFTSTNLEAGFERTQRITFVSDKCTSSFPLRCAGLRDFHLTANDSLDVMAAALNAYRFDGKQGDIWFALGEDGEQQFFRAVNISRGVLSSPEGNDYNPRMAMDATGARIFISWTEISPSGNYMVNLAHSSDSGETWSGPFVEDGWNVCDLDYARSAERLFWAYHTGYYFGDPQNPSRVDVRISNDGGETLGAATIAAIGYELPDTSTMEVTHPVRVAVSGDGQVVAVLHAEERCDPVLGCLGGFAEPFDIVLNVSEDAGATYKRVGVVAQSYFSTFDLSVRDDGQEVYITTDSTSPDGTVFLRAVRQ